MSRLDEVLGALAEDSPHSYWFEVVSEQVENALSAYEPYDWELLTESLSVLSDEQLGRLSCALVNVESPQGREMLLRLIVFGCDALARGACDSLRAQLEASGEQVTVSAQLFDYIAVLSARCQEPWKASCERLLRHLRV